MRKHMLLAATVACAVCAATAAARADVLYLKCGNHDFFKIETPMMKMTFSDDMGNAGKELYALRFNQSEYSGYLGTVKAALFTINRQTGMLTISVNGALRGQEPCVKSAAPPPPAPTRF
jgi:hypothetical protein